MTNTQEKTNNIEEQIQDEIQEARNVCDISGNNSAECAAAWDAVEELQAEASHQRQTKPKNSLEQYCDANPDADECRVYED
ncbi:Calvin cycle protein CP12 [Okeanomitos corallinicola TIOX110]|uniref:Calvin cycle protein CP12 n=1 Tax=Okeanomitos corallinicola TIOX110 TaxID=3133117 RepID=A0ABZ2UT01_9CYAN